MRTGHIYICIALAAVVIRCAQIVPLSGGPRDTTPPQLLAAIPPANSTSITPNTVVLKFDEFVQLKDLSGQLIVTPKLDPQPDVAAEGKSIRITFEKDSLKPNTTYRVLFGNAIADLNESNPVTGFSYVFSTGIAIDTFRLSGAVTDALTAVAAGDGIAGLYETDSPDSIIFREKPLYRAKMTAGAFSFQNLPERTFRLYAFNDRNKNGMYDGAAEQIAFAGYVQPMPADTTIPMRLFQEEVVKGFVKSVSSRQYGIGQIILNKPMKVEFVPLRAEDQPNVLFADQNRQKDTLTFFYRGITDTLVVALKLPAKTDTVKITLPPGKRKRRVNFTHNLSTGKLAPGDSVRLRFQAWMDTAATDSRRIRLQSKEDSLIGERPMALRWRSANELLLFGKLQDNATYSLKLDTAAFTDMNGAFNDSTEIFFRYQPLREFGTLKLNITCDKKQSYLLQLLGATGQPVRQVKFTIGLSQSSVQQFVFDKLVPGEFTVKLIYDDNDNGRWDTGDVIARKQPESIFIHEKKMSVTAEWETEEDITLIQNKTKKE